MKAFIDKIFKAKKQKELLDDNVNTKVIEENKEILSKQIETSIKKHIEKVEEEVEEVEEVEKVEEHNPSNIGPGI